MLHLRQAGHPCRLRAIAGHTVGRTDLSTRPRVAWRRLAAATVEAIGTGLRRAQLNRAAQFLREVATEADRRPIVRHSTCGSQSCNRVLRADILAVLAQHQVTVAEAEAAMLHQATAAGVDTQHHLAAEAIAARPVTVAAVVAATVHPVVVTVAAIAAVEVADTLPAAAVEVADTLLAAAVEVADTLPAAAAAAVIPREEVTAAIARKSCD